MQTRTRSALVVLGFYLVAGVPAIVAGAPVGQTTSRPGVDCSLLTRTQATGLHCATAPKPDDVYIGPLVDGAELVPAAWDCTPKPNPYVEVARAVRCAAWQRSQMAAPPLPTFTVGGSYVHPYPHIRMVVLAVSLSLDGVPVVTAQFTGGEMTGQVFAFRADQGTPWTLLP